MLINAVEVVAEDPGDIVRIEAEPSVDAHQRVLHQSQHLYLVRLLILLFLQCSIFLQCQCIQTEDYALAATKEEDLVLVQLATTIGESAVEFRDVKSD